LIRPARTNPAADPGASFDALEKPSPQVSAVLERACRDCHSNRTVWPWYSGIAPASWLVAWDVNEGREHLNFSEWSRRGAPKSGRLEAICAEAREGDMPPWRYTLLHPEARLGEAHVAALCRF